MRYLTGAALETGIGCLIWLPMLIGWAVWKRWSISKTAMLAVFLVYLTGVFELVGLPGLKYFSFNPDVYLGAFVGMMDDRINSVLNVLLFVPMGFLLTLFCRECRSIGKTVFIGFLLSLFIEFSQLFCFRLTDVNDLITNTAGTFLGAGFAKMIIPKSWNADLSLKEIMSSALLSSIVLFISWQYVLDYIWTL